MEDDDQHKTVQVINDIEDDNGEEVLIDTPIGPETVLMDTTAVPQLVEDDDDDALRFHCTQCNLTLASSQNFKRHQQSKRHQSKVSSSEHHCDVCDASFKSINALERHEQTLKHQDNELRLHVK